MTPQALLQLIGDEIKNSNEPIFWPGRPIPECLLEPKRQRFLNSHNNDEPEELWLVFEEGPNPGEGYKMVYDEELNLFGLAVEGEKEPVLIGFYGNFLETLNSM
jgi:hypothetical protein